MLTGQLTGCMIMCIGPGSARPNPSGVEVSDMACPTGYRPSRIGIYDRIHQQWYGGWGTWVTSPREAWATDNLTTACEMADSLQGATGVRRKLIPSTIS